MNERIKNLWNQSAAVNDNSWAGQTRFIECFAESIVEECIREIQSECEDFENGNCFADNDLWVSVTREYGPNKERGFDPVGMGIHFKKILKERFGLNDERKN